MKKLTRRNQEWFFSQKRDWTSAVTNGPEVEPGEFFTASKNFQYAEIQEIAAMSDVAARRANLEDMQTLKETADEWYYKQVKTNYWEKDAKNLFVCITREEYEERAQKLAQKQKEYIREMALGRVESWFDQIIGSLEWVLDDLKRERANFKHSVETNEKGIGYRAERKMDDAIGRIKGIHFNLPLDRAVTLTGELREALDPEDFKSPYF